MPATEWNIVLAHNGIPHVFCRNAALLRENRCVQKQRCDANREGNKTRKIIERLIGKEQRNVRADAPGSSRRWALSSSVPVLACASGSSSRPSDDTAAESSSSSSSFPSASPCPLTWNSRGEGDVKLLELWTLTRREENWNRAEQEDGPEEGRHSEVCGRCTVESRIRREDSSQNFSGCRV